MADLFRKTDPIDIPFLHLPHGNDPCHAWEMGGAFDCAMLRRFLFAREKVTRDISHNDLVVDRNTLEAIVVKMKGAELSFYDNDTLVVIGQRKRALVGVSTQGGWSILPSDARIKHRACLDQDTSRRAAWRQSVETWRASAQGILPALPRHGASVDEEEKTLISAFSQFLPEGMEGVVMGAWPGKDGWHAPQLLLFSGAMDQGCHAHPQNPIHQAWDELSPHFWNKNSSHWLSYQGSDNQVLPTVVCSLDRGYGSNHLFLHLQSLLSPATRAGLEGTRTRG